MKEEFAKKILEKVIDDYDTIAEDFSATRTRIWPEMERIREFVRGGDRVVDIGCGNGRAYQLFQGMAIEYEGVDVSSGLIAQARSRVRDLLANFRVGSMLALPYDDAGFNAAICIAALHHVPSKKYRIQALREANRVIKPGGILFMTNWDRWKPAFWKFHLVTILKKHVGATGLDFKDVLIPWKGGKTRAMRYYHSFTKGELAALCRAAGFDVVDNYYTKAGVRTGWWKGDNLVTICRKRKD
jgi:ubiquinone/menaquinone biosynthesis C-methylase UbiE